MSDGQGKSYTENLAEVRGFMERLEERIDGVRSDVSDFKDTIESIDARLRTVEQGSTKTSARQDVIMWFLALLGAGMVTLIFDAISGVFK